MHEMNKCFLYFFFFISILLTPNIMKGDSFMVKSENELNIICNGETFIKKDMLSLVSLSDAEFQSLGMTGEWEKVTVLKGGSKKGCIYYREVGYKPGRVEITWYIKYAPFQFGTDFLGHTYNGPGATYEMKIPAQLLDGARYKASTGSTLFGMQIKEGVLSSTQPEGVIIEKTIRYIIFTKNGKSFTLDLNPLGPLTSGFKDLQTERDWRLTRDGQYFSLWSDMNKVKWGDAAQFKITIIDKEKAYEDAHITNKMGHIPLISPTLNVIFGKENPQASLYTMADNSIYQKEKGFGWADNNNIELIETDFESLIRKCHIKGRGRQNFYIDAKDGLYLINLISGSSKEESGIFNISANSKLKLKNIKLEKGDFITKTIYAWAEKGKIILSLDGDNWMLNALSLTPLLYNEEDYILKNTFFIQQDKFDQWFSNVEPIPAMADIIPEKVTGDRMDWTWNCALEDLGASIDSSRAELDTIESLEHRLNLIKSGGFKAVIINGLHFRYNHRDSIRNKIMLRNNRLAVEVAHKLGLKVIDHLDLNWVLYQGIPSMLKVLDKDPDCLQRNYVYPLQIARAFCLNSQEHIKEVVNYLIEEQKTANVDGFMLDEEYFAAAPYCACDRCRKLFYEETGYKLPYDHITGFYNDFNNKIWREYFSWKGKKVMEIFGVIKDEVQKQYPHVVFFCYTSAPISRVSGEALEFNKLFSWDYIGDEFHPEDVMQNWRVIFARLKNRQGVASSWGNAPTWILAKFSPKSDMVMYAWALGRMVRGNVWYRAGDYSFSNKLQNWPYQMKDKDARPLSDVAVLLSQYTRDFREGESYYHEEYTAWLQTLAEMSIQYDVILDRDITLDKLKKYKVLLLANTAILSEAQANQVKKFISDGGSVIASYETGLFDEKGERREDSVFRDVMNMKKLGYVSQKTEIKLKAELAEEMKVTKLDTDIKQCAYEILDKAKCRVLAEAVDPVTNKALVPAIVEIPFGKGNFYYISGSFVKENYEPRMTSTTTHIHWMKDAAAYKVRFNKDLNILVRNLLTRAIGEDYKTKAVKIPEGVIYAAFHQKYEGKESILIHFLNCQGKPYRKYGEPLLLLDPVPQPPLPFDVELKIKSDSGIKEAFIVSPLKEEKIEVKISLVETNCYSVTVPKEAIKNYAILYLNK